MTGECNYGGRVTDEHDRRTLMSILSVFYTNDIFNDSYQFSSAGHYFAPLTGDYEETIQHIKDLPLTTSPEVYGLHPNADITKDIQEVEILCSSTIAMRSSGANSFYL